MIECMAGAVKFGDNIYLNFITWSGIIMSLVGYWGFVPLVINQNPENILCKICRSDLRAVRGMPLVFLYVMVYT